MPLQKFTTAVAVVAAVAAAVVVTVALQQLETDVFFINLIFRKRGNNVPLSKPNELELIKLWHNKN